ncbi:hypothetical protein V6L77_07370 [Pannonibacter sp. Pt2-lr]
MMIFLIFFWVLSGLVERFRLALGLLLRAGSVICLSAGRLGAILEMRGSFFRAEISGDFALCCFGFLVGVGFWGVFVSVLFFCDYMSDFKRFYPRFWRGFFVFLD